MNSPIKLVDSKLTIAPMEKTKLPQNIIDDIGFEFMLQAISRQMDYFKRLSLDAKIKIGKREITRKHLYESLKKFRVLVVEALNCTQVYQEKICYDQFNLGLNQNFEAYRPIPKKTEQGYSQKKTLFTAYYSPDLDGSFTQSEKFKNPIYGMPTDPKLSGLVSDEINYENALANKGLELFYVSDSLFDIWLLHVEGGGRVRVKDDDGRIHSYYLSYAGTNKKAFRMIARAMVEKGILKNGDFGVQSQRSAFNKYPELQREILASSPSYVFFKVTENEPLGVGNIPLTPGRSLATDYRIYKEYGLISLVQTRRPMMTNGQFQQKQFSRFFINQDTGGAIKGNARSDLYFGYGEKAELTANNLSALGDQYFIILK